MIVCKRNEMSHVKMNLIQIQNKTVESENNLVHYTETATQDMLLLGKIRL